MKFLDKLGFGKKEEEEKKEEDTLAPKTNRLVKIFQVLNSPAGIGLNHTPRRTPREKQLGIPEYVSPTERVPDFTPQRREVPKAKKVIINWRPRPGVQNKKGSSW